MTKAANIELSLYRSGLLRSKIVPHHLETACKGIARHVARLDRWRLAECNGIPRYDPKANGVFASWTDDDTALMEKQVEESREAIKAALKAFIVPGCQWKFYTDPRAGVVLRISNKANTRDSFL